MATNCQATKINWSRSTKNGNVIASGVSFVVTGTTVSLSVVCQQFFVNFFRY